eukprot:4811542-Amphidinium_carterae.1
MPPKCRQYCQRYLDKVGIRSFYNFNYTAILQSGSDRMEANPAELEKLGLSNVRRVYMAVGTCSINQFLPEQCLEDCRYDKGIGAIGRGGFICCSRQMQVLQQDESGEVEPFGGGRVYAAGSCCSVQGLRLPKNASPAEGMAKVACHNIKVTERLRSSGYCGWFRLLKRNSLREMHWSVGTGVCATSLGPDDATMVVFSSPEPGSGYTVATGLLAAYQKEFIRWAKVDQSRLGCFGQLIGCLIH